MKTVKKLRFFGIGKLLPYLKPYAVLMTSMVVLGFLGSLIDIVVPLFQRYAINHFIAEQTLEHLNYFIYAYLAVIVFQVVTNGISSYFACKTEMYVNRDLRRRGFNHLQTLSVAYYSQNSVGYIHARLMSDTGLIGMLCSWTLMEAVWNLSYIVGGIAVMFALEWRLALAIVAIVPIVVTFAVFYRKKYADYNRRIRETNSQISGSINEGITGAKTIKSLVLESRFNREFREETSEMNRLSVRAAAFRSTFMSFISFAGSIALAIVLWQGGIISAKDVAFVGTLSVFMTYAQGMMDPISWLVGAISSLINAQVNIERFTDLMETPSDVSDSPEVLEKYGDAFHAKTENWEKLHGDVTFEDVSFRYPDGEEYVLEHFDLHVPKGSTVAIVGETGAGKSTLVNLVCRFYEPTEGRLLIDGRDAKERSQQWLHSNIGYVLQTPHLFSGTIRDNIRYGKPDATDEEIEIAARYVSADAFIRKLKDGYDTQVGEGGDLLSTGEKQLISFARAILVDPAIFIFDEVTSSVDTVTEQIILQTIDKIIRDKTTFMIAHRLSTVHNADVILAVRDGKIVERGTHAELMAAKGYYYSLYMCQFNEEQLSALFDL